MPSPSNPLGASIREALGADAERIALLALQLGYEVPVSHVESQLRSLSEWRRIFVAVVPRAGVVGWIGVSARDSLIESGRCEIEGLVVEDEYRGNGIGELLVRTAQEWARRRGCTQMRLNSNVVRERAHEFYRRLGFDVLKTQRVFLIAL